MKLIRSINKYIFVLAGVPVIQFDGYRTPYHVYRRVLPFMYKNLGTCWIAHWDKPEDIEEWIKEKEADK